MVRGMHRRLSSTVLSPSAKTATGAFHYTITKEAAPLSKPVQPDFLPFFPKKHRPFHFDDFFERIYRFYIPLLERKGYNMHRQNEIHEYVIGERSTPMSWNTKITKLLGIDYPIIQGGMAYISDGVLAAAMNHAGCAGVIGSGGFTVDEIRDHIRQAKDILGPGKCFGVNLMLQMPNKDDVAQLICDEKVPFVTIGAGNPVPYFDPFHHAGVKCIPVVPNVKLAHRVQDAGADALVVEGMEAGGHDGKITLMALLENVLPEIEIPVVAAGGIVDGRAIAAALLMGASGVQMGTRFLLSEECRLHPNAKQAIIDAADTDSVVTGFTTRDTVRGLRNPFSEKYLKLEYSGAPQSELTALAAGTNRKAVIDGDTENGFVLAGMSLTHLTKIQPVQEIVEELVSEAERRLAAAPKLI